MNDVIYSMEINEELDLDKDKEFVVYHVNDGVSSYSRSYT